jgi:hypothetical protein
VRSGTRTSAIPVSIRAQLSNPREAACADDLREKLLAALLQGLPDHFGDDLHRRSCEIVHGAPFWHCSNCSIGIPLGTLCGINLHRFFFSRALAQVDGRFKQWIEAIEDRLNAGYLLEPEVFVLPQPIEDYVALFRAEEWRDLRDSDDAIFEVAEHLIGLAGHGVTSDAVRLAEEEQGAPFSPE